MSHRSHVAAARREAGLSLIELMVSLAIGTFLVAGAVLVYSNGRNTYALNESIARVQENARYVISVLEPDLELAGYYGFTNAAGTVQFVSGASPGTVYATANAMRQWSVDDNPVTAAPVANLPPNAHSCGTNFAVDVLLPVQGSNGAFAVGRDPATECDAYGAGAQPGSDTLTIRRASSVTAPPEAGRLQIYASRLRSQSAQQLFADGTAPGPIDDDNEVRDLVVHTYYVSRDSVDRPGVPALRVKSLSTVGGRVTFTDEEVMPGVEDLQVQFGVDTGDYDNDGTIDASADLNFDGIPESDGRATRYIDFDAGMLSRFQVVSVRVWVRVRSEGPETGFVDNRRYQYADEDYLPSGGDVRFRRALVSRTITLRNARTL